MTQGGHDLHFYYDAQGKPGIVLFDGTPYAYLYNLQGDVIALANTAGTIVCSYGYDAWGVPVTRTGSMAGSGTVGFIQPFRYRGYVWDEETGLYYLRSRYYRPSWGRFVSADETDNISEAESNLYFYCVNSSVNFDDPDGCGLKDFFKRIRERFLEGGNSPGKIYLPTDGLKTLRTTMHSTNHGSHGGKPTSSNPYGRKGSPAHQEIINNIADMAIKANVAEDGYSIITEFQVKTPGGHKDVRYADLAIIIDNTNKGFLFQIGVLNKNGLPVSREVYAIMDIENAGYTTIFVPYRMR